MIQISGKLKELIEENALAFATVDSEGKPHCIALGFVKVFEKNRLVITDNHIKESIANIKKNNNVSLAVWNTNWKEDCIGFELKGKAEYFTKGKFVEMIKKIPENKGEPCKGAIVVAVEKMKALI